MHVLENNVDLTSLLQIVFTLLISAFALLHLVKNTASKYFEPHANFGSASSAAMLLDQPCFVCGKSGSKQCSRCKSVRYCSQACQSNDWSSGHMNKCKKIDLSGKLNSTSLTRGIKAYFKGSNSAGISSITSTGGSKVIQTKKILFPYDEFIAFFNWDTPEFRPCGLINCNNSCFANVILQCLSFTRPLVAYLLKKGHQRECRHNDWCFLCEFQIHVERASQNLQPFSPINILSRLPNIGGNLGGGRHEDAHEFMRFVIDKMQSDCLDEFGGERAVHPSSQETTLIQHIFGGQLQSQVICTQCKKASNQYENMMDLTVEIHGNVSSLEECLNQFTAEEWLHGDNMYKCDGCNDYVKACKRLTIQTPPNVLTIALKRFQSGRFGKLNKEVTFPETLDLGPYMSDAGDGTDVYKLYAVVVHVDLLNASCWGHYICYVKDFRGSWFEVNDCMVKPVGLKKVLSQGSYMLLYSRASARPSCLKATEHLEDEKEKVKVEPCSRKQEDSFSPDSTCNSLSFCERELSVADNSESTGELGYTDVLTSSSNSLLSQESSDHENGSSSASSSEVPAYMNEDTTPMSSSPTLKKIPRQDEESSILNNVGAAKRARQMTVVDPASLASLSAACCSEEEPEATGENPKDAVLSKSSAASTKNLEVYSNGHVTMEYDGFPVKEAQGTVSNSFPSPDETSAKVNYLKHELLHTHIVEDGNGVKIN